MPTRREPVAVKMTFHMHKKCTGQYPGRLNSVLCDLNVLGMFCGFCLCKWAQNTLDKKKSLISADGLSLAFISPYLNFLGVDWHTILQSWSSELHDAGIKFAKFQFRTHKTLNNGETISQDRHQTQLCVPCWLPSDYEIILATSTKRSTDY